MTNDNIMIEPGSELVTGEPVATASTTVVPAAAPPVDPLQKIVPAEPVSLVSREQLADIVARHSLWLESVLSPRVEIGTGRASFAGAEMPNFDFSGVVLSGASFRGANLEGSDFSGAHLVGCDFSDTNLKGAKFDGAKVNRARFVRANVEGATWEAAQIDKADFQLCRGRHSGTAEVAPAEEPAVFQDPGAEAPKDS